jgi:hypothetical protein
MKLLARFLRKSAIRLTPPVPAPSMLFSPGFGCPQGELLIGEFHDQGNNIEK